MMVHWWLPGTAPCGADLPERFTGEPAQVTCPECLAYVRARMAAARRRRSRWPFPHIHRDPDWRSTGIHAYYQCRCGARRVRWLSRTMAGPVARGWPALVDRHGMPVTDTGWVKP